MDLFKTADEAARDFSLEAAISSLSSDNVLTRFRIMPVHMPSCKKDYFVIRALVVVQVVKDWLSFGS